MADLYLSKVEKLASALQREDTRLKASESLRGLVDSIVLTPRDGQLGIELRGNLAAMVTAAQQTKKRSPKTGDLSLQVSLVAGRELNSDFASATTTRSTAEYSFSTLPQRSAEWDGRATAVPLEPGCRYLIPDEGIAMSLYGA